MRPGGLDLSRCTISNNENLGGVEAYTGEVANCVIADNSGTGVASQGEDFVVKDSLISGNGGFGAYVEDAKLTNCRILDNDDTGLKVGDTGPDEQVVASIEDCEIRGNGRSEAVPYQGYRTGGVEIAYGNARLADCIIEGNTGTLAGGGGVSVTNASATLSGCTVDGNTTGDEGGALSGLQSKVVLVDSRLRNNQATNFGQGGIHLSRGSDLSMTNCVVAGNESRYAYGDGLIGYLADATATNCTFEGNSIVVRDSSTLSLTNSIVWNGTGSLSVRDGATATVTYCDLPEPVAGEGNISEDPLFAAPWDETSGDWRLDCGSPCVDAGTEEGAPGADILGIPRPIGEGVDMGAYENCRMDLDGDREESGKDVLFFPMEWLRPADPANCRLDVSDESSSHGRIDSADLLLLLRDLQRSF